MDDPERDYLVPDGLPVAELKAALLVRGPLGEEPPQAVERTYLDTFDWRLHLEGAVLEMETGAAGRRLRWLGETGSREQDLPAAAVAFADDLPAGPVRERVGPAAGIRRLLPVVGVETAVQVLSLCNDDDKTVLRVHLETSRFLDARDGRSGPLSTRLRLVPLKGYEDDLEASRRLLEDGLGLVPARTSLYREALAAAGRRPGDYSSRLDYRLDPHACADEAARRILLGLLDTLEANVSGARDNLDPEFLHDLRVATRRTRSALGQITGVFPEPAVADFKARFAWLQQVTGPVRDLDVYLLGFAEYRAALPAPQRPHLDPLRAYLEGHHAQARAALVRDLESDTFVRLLRDWRAFLNAPDAERAGRPNALRPVAELASERIWRTLRRVRREGRALGPESPPEAMHELRKRCKKLRYLMEFFQSLYPPGAVAEAVRLLKKLLDNLGTFQDLAVQAAHLGAIARDMHREGATADTLLAMGVLVGDLYRRQQQARQDFAELFARFDDDANRAFLRGLFRPDPRPKETP